MKKIIFLTLILLCFTTTSILADASISPADAPEVKSETAVLMDADSGQIIYGKNEEKTMYPASLTKIATAIYAIENSNLDETVTVSEKARKTDGTRVYLEPGEEVPLQKLLQGLLVNSGNDAGVAIAEHMEGSVSAFADSLNAFLEEEIGVVNTHFENPHGLYHEDHVTTAKDLAAITQYAMQNEHFRNIVGTKKLNWKGESWETTIFSHHRLMREDPYDGVTGGKTGYVDESGFTLETTAERDHIRLIVITMKSDSQNTAYEDTKQLLDYGFKNFESASMAKGKTYEDEGKTYTLKQPFYYTKQKKQTTSNYIKNDTLYLIDQQGNDVASLILEPTNQEKSMPSKSIKTNTHPLTWQNIIFGKMMHSPFSISHIVH
ncbi:D-alanyl-D-alanine carboxypeptidase family protein [Pontibacillus salicampi]|uniref:D-alanyl-D-alanine carboxypeptidase family protein n=1 Tax=Pontibacillus salicampi TaxID=1449801 RepID=A0ABV6LK77_9BACI